LVLVGRGLTNKEIAPELHITERGVAAAVSRLLVKFNASNRASLLVMSLKPSLPQAVLGFDYHQFDDSPYIVSVWYGPDLVLVYVNKRFTEVSGRTAEDLLGRTVGDVFPQRTADSIARVQAVYATGEPGAVSLVATRWMETQGTWREGSFDLIHLGLRGPFVEVAAIMEIAIESRR
jgi:PAS domain-containing protein